MKRITIRWIIGLAVLLLVGLITTQVMWLGKAYDVTEQQFNNDVTRALKNTAIQILHHKNDSTSLFDPVEQISPSYFRVSINDTLHPYYLESLLNSEFKNWGIDTDFEYSIYDCFNDSVVFTKYVSEKESRTAVISPPINWDKDGHYFGVYFPSKKGHLLARMKFWIFSSGLLLLVMLFFAYTISVILKQKRLSEVKTDFINNMTHEFKTPISTISLSSEVLMNPDILEQPDRLMNYARIISQENNRLKAQVDKVLQIAFLDRGAHSLKKKQVNMHDVIERVADNTALGFSEKNGRLLKKLEAENPVIEADEVHLTNIIYNLLDNACKYSKGNPEVEVITRNRNNKIIISVKDNGIGINPENQKFVFDKFFRVPTGNVHNVKGFGLGLHYVQLMIKAHQGQVKLYSELGKGSIFEICLPRKT